MYIKEVDLKNFKSFGKRVRVPLHNDFITITGPNGSGKSNIVDALLFAFSLSSSRAMRAERLPDLIYRGDNGNNPDFAQVTVRLDNTSRTIPIDEDLIEISRKVKSKNDKYYATYYFNGKSCSQGELHDQLAKAGISSEGYNVVMQGDVTRIIEMTPMERRKIIDEIAGIAEFDEKKKRALGELEVVREKIDRVDVILEEVGAQVEKLKTERDRALAYKARRDEKRLQEGFLLLSKLKEAELELSELEGESGELENEIVRLHKEADVQKEELSALEDKLKTLDSEISNKGENKQIEIRRRIEELKGQIAREESRGEMSDREIAEIGSEQRENYIEAENLHAESEMLSTNLNDAYIRRATIQAELDELKDELNSTRAKISETDVEYSQLRDELINVRNLQEDAKAKRGDLLRERDRLLDATRRRSGERKEVAEEIAEASETIATFGEESEQLRAELAELNRRALDLERERDDLDGTRLRIKREIAESDRNLQKIQGEYARAEARLRAAENKTGYNRAVEAVRSAMRKQQLGGLYGTIAELGDVRPKYSAALEVAAGGRLQSIVAENDIDASTAIDFLKRAKIGRATFLPLTKMRTGSLPSLPHNPGVVDYALKLVEFENRFLPAFWHVFRDTLIVDDLGTARQLMGRYRMVTLDGDLVERSGAMTGGHFKSRQRFTVDERKHLVDLSEKLSIIENTRSKFMDDLDAIDEKSSNIDRIIDSLDKKISRMTFRLEEILVTSKKLDKTIEERRSRLINMEGEALESKERLDEIEMKLQGFESAVLQYQSKIEEVEKNLRGSDVPDLTSRAEQAEEVINSLSDRYREIDAEIMRFKLKQDSISHRQSEMATRRQKLDAQKEEAALRKRMATEKAEELQETLKAMGQKEEEIEIEIHGLKGERGGLLDGMLALQRNVDSLEREIDRMEARMIASSRAVDEVKNVVQELQSKVEERGVDSTETPPRSETVKRKIRELERMMEELEPVNMLAIEEFQRVQNRYDTLHQRRETLHRERGEIIDKLDKYDKMKNNSFMTCFDEINKNFRVIFSDLSGGEGELTLENPEDPLSAGMTIKARPAGKAFHRLEAMSGGEKSLTALSFIFAIQRFKPAPFYAFDEIDMFLDGVNAERVAKMIHKLSEKAQFIVVSLRKPMIQEAKYTLGVTIQENNISSVSGICMNGKGSA